MSGDCKKYYDRIIKLLVLGDSDVGKSCLLLRFVDENFNVSFMSTIGIDLRVKTINLNNEKVRLQIWDTAGQERFRAITNAHYKKADGILLVYDVTSKESFENINRWKSDIEEHAPKTAKMILVANKCDLESIRVVEKRTGQNLAKQHGVGFLETSAKTGKNVNKIFIDIARSIVNGKDENKNLEHPEDVVNLNEIPSPPGCRGAIGCRQN